MYLRDRSGGRWKEKCGRKSVSWAISRQMSLTLITIEGTKQANKTQLKATLRKQVPKTSIRLWLESCYGEKCESIVLFQHHLTTNNLIWVYTGWISTARENWWVVSCHIWWGLVKVRWRDSASPGVTFISRHYYCYFNSVNYFTWEHRC